MKILNIKIRSLEKKYSKKYILSTGRLVEYKGYI